MGLYSVILTEYVVIDPRLSVCVCLCVCVISTAKTDGPILMKLSTNHLLYICSMRFSSILKLKFDDVMVAILAVFGSGTLMVAILLRFSSNFGTLKLKSVPCLLLKISKIG